MPRSKRLCWLKRRVKGGYTPPTGSPGSIHRREVGSPDGKLHRARSAVPGARDLDTTTVESLRWASRWRNYLVHDDAQARERLHQFVAAGSEVQQLTAAMATEVIDRCDAAFTDGGSILGATTLAGLHSDFLWREADES